MSAGTGNIMATPSQLLFPRILFCLLHPPKGWPINGLRQFLYFNQWNQQIDIWHSHIKRKKMKARKSWSSIMQKLRDHRGQPRLLYPAKFSITIDRQNKIFHNRTRFNQCLATNPALHKVLEEKRWPKEVSYINKNKDNRLSHSSKYQRRGTHTQ